MTDAAPPKLRRMRPGDRAYVAQSWVSSYVNSSAARALSDVVARLPEIGAYALALEKTPRRHGAPTLYFPLQRALVDRLIAKSDVRVLCTAEDDDVIVGWRAVHDDLLHYVLVSPDFRRMGMARALVADLLDRPMRMTHLSDDAGAVIGKLPPTWRFEPEALKESL